MQYTEINVSECNGYPAHISSVNQCLLLKLPQSQCQGPDLCVGCLQIREINQTTGTPSLTRQDASVHLLLLLYAKLSDSDKNLWRVTIVDLTVTVTVTVVQMMTEKLSLYFLEGQFCRKVITLC